MKRILIVEDERPIAEMMSGILGDEGYAVELAKHGREALTMMKRNPPDLLIVDVMMPIMGGIEFCTILQNEPGHNRIPVILMSAAGHPPSDPSCHYTRFLSKPFDIDTLILVIEEVLDMASSV